MDMNIETVAGTQPVTILHPHGRVDGSNYQMLIDQAGQLYQSGARRLVVDLAEVSFLSSAGLVALHTLALIMSGQKPPEQQDGWHALASIERDVLTGAQPYVKLVNPQPKVAGTLQMSGMDAYFNIYNSVDEAIAAFSF